jgi:hypothetical protein
MPSRASLQFLRQRTIRLLQHSCIVHAESACTKPEAKAACAVLIRSANPSALVTVVHRTGQESPSTGVFRRSLPNLSESGVNPGSAFDYKWCPRPDSNRHGRSRGILSPLCLPVSPPGPGWGCGLGCRAAAARSRAVEGGSWRLRSESNRRPRLCRPLHNHSATQPKPASIGIPARSVTRAQRQGRLPRNGRFWRRPIGFLARPARRTTASARNADGS